MEFEDETLAERLWGLTEMFPEPVRNVTGYLFETTTSATKTVLSWSKSGLWVVASSFTILILPIVIEQERSGMEEAHAMQSRELLLGPSAASSGSSASGLPGSIPFGLTPPAGAK